MNARTSPEADDSRILAALALAMVDHPRATLQELAQAVGISKATLYRFCRTRDQLIQRLTTHAISAMNQATEESNLETDPPAVALRKLITNHLEHREWTAFITHFWNDVAREMPAEVIAECELKMDAFFLRGQQAGIFRIDVTAATLSELWFSVVIGMVDAERRGRVARAGLALVIEKMFLEGSGTR